MTLHLETITDKMKSVAKVIFGTLGANYYLAGGTALALQLGHRVSVDLDYFSSEPIDTQLLKNNIRDSFSKLSVEFFFEEQNTLWCNIDGVKVSFITRKDSLLKPVTEHDVFRLASIEDITVMKLSAICSRNEFKDYFDIACIANITDVRSWASWWNDVYENVDITSWLVALGSVDTVTEIPLEISDSFKKLDVKTKIKSVTQEITDFLR